MKTKIINKLNNIYNIVKIEYGPYRYYILIYILFITTFTIDMITFSRIIRFIVTCVILIIYKKLHAYIETQKFNLANLNIKIIILLMWINILQNPIIYVIWRWDLYMYAKLENIIYDIFKNKNYYIFIKLLIWNISIPIKLVYIRFYLTLSHIKTLSFKNLMFSRIYGLIISILIFSDIIHYLLDKTGGFIYLIIYIYILMYGINIIYTFYYYYFEKKQEKFKIFKNFVIYNILQDYFNIINKLNIGIVYEERVKVSIIGNCIKFFLINNFKDYKTLEEMSIVTNNIKSLRLYLYKMPEIWRYWIYEIKLVTKFFESYWDNIIILKLYLIKLETFKNNNNFYNNNHYNVYFQIFFTLSELFKAFESVLYYKYYVYKQGYKEYNKYSEGLKNPKISIIEYNYIYKTYLLILKNILHFIWSFEYNILKDKTKISKFYVVEDINLEFGFHIYLKNIQVFSPYNSFNSNILITRDIYLKSINKNKVHYNEPIYESIELLSKLINYAGKEHLMYIGYVENKQLKNFDLWYNEVIKKLDLNNWYENDLSLLKIEIASEYFLELKNVMNELYQEWERSGEYNIFEKREAFKALVNHYNNNKIIK